MRREGQALWKKVFGNPGGQDRQEKVLAYVANRLRNGASLEEAVGDDYVQRNLSPADANEVVSDPELVRSVRERMESTFEAGVLGSGAPSAAAESEQ
jgi:hypothetical protein